MENNVVSNLIRDEESFVVPNKEEKIHYGKGLVTDCFSNYPTHIVNDKMCRVGDPTADAFCVYRCSNFSVYCLCDGCGLLSKCYLIKVLTNGH